MFDALGDVVPEWITHNEPWVTSFLGYAYGSKAPGVSDWPTALGAAHHSLLAHGAAVRAFRERGGDGRIGITLDLTVAIPASDSPEDEAAALRLDGHHNRWFLDPIFRGAYPADALELYEQRFGPLDAIQDGDLELISQPIDFLGINFYRPNIVAANDDGSVLAIRDVDPDVEHTAMGWAVVPSALTELLLRLERDYGGVPFLVTENGAAFDDTVSDGAVDDDRRLAYLEEHIDALERARAQGADVRGYYVWSFLDNFEWEYGYEKRSGSSLSTSTPRRGSRSGARSGTATGSRPGTEGSNAMAKIDFRELTKIFPGGTRAVDELDLEIGDGEFMVVVGPSGSGKTTVLRIAAGLDRATHGEVWIGEELVNDVPPMDRNIAMVFQSYALYPHMTVYENMAFGLKLHGLKKKEIEPRVRSTAKMLGIDELLKRKPGQLSGGQRQRVAMGRAIVREPDAFLMDEPLSNLDAKLRVEMRAYLATLHQRLQTTTLYVTHDQTEAMTMGDRVAVMRDGQLQQVDTPQRLYEHPVNLFVAGFIGSPAMNLVHSQLEERDGQLFVQFGPASLRIPDTTLAARPSLRGYAGRPVIAGLRPEDIEDASMSRPRTARALTSTLRLPSRWARS